MSDAELKEYRLQLESVEAALKADPENVELFALVAELSTLVAELGGVVKAPTEGQTPSSSANYPSSPYGSNGTSRRDTPATPVEGGAGSGSSIYAVGDNVLARWTSGDNQLYPARITSVMGSQKNPVYIVKFTQYNATETLHPQHIKPANNANKKRKLENEPTSNASTTPTSTSNGAIISQPATINAELAEANKRKSTETLDGPQKPAKAGRKIAQNKVLEDGKKKWQNFAQKGVKGKVGKAKKIGESSMFRTPDGVHGRVGFTGSGQPMRKDATRGKHIYQQGDEEE